MSPVVPLELLDKCIGSRVWIIMRNDKEFVGVLAGFDDYVNVVLEGAEEFELLGEVYVSSQVGSMLLNGNGILEIVPGGEGPLKAKTVRNI